MVAEAGFYHHKTNPLIGVLLLLAAIMAIAVWLLSVNRPAAPALQVSAEEYAMLARLSPHAVAKHGEHVVDHIHTCIEKGGAEAMLWSDYDGGRRAIACMLSDGGWGLEIQDGLDGTHITGFKHRAKTIQKLIEILVASDYGFELLWQK